MTPVAWKSRVTNYITTEKPEEAALDMYEELYPKGTVVDLKDALNTLLWLYHRLPYGYFRVPFVEKSIKALAKATGIEVKIERS